MRKIIIALLAALALTGCNEVEDKERTYHGHPIDCVEKGNGHGKTMSCDFVGWHQRWDEVK